MWNKIPPTRPDNFKAYISKIVRSISIDKFRKQKAKKRSADMVMALDELADVLPDERYERKVTHMLAHTRAQLKEYLIKEEIYL